MGNPDTTNEDEDDIDDFREVSELFGLEEDEDEESQELPPEEWEDFVLDELHRAKYGSAVDLELRCMPCVPNEQFPDILEKLAREGHINRRVIDGTTIYLRKTENPFEDVRRAVGYLGNKARDAYKKLFG